MVNAMINGIWLVSYIGLWLLVLILLLAVVTLARQVGLLHGRLGPAGARMTNAGPEVGAVAPLVKATDLDGRIFDLGGERRQPLLLVFLSATCGTCAEAAPAVRALWKAERKRLEIVIVSLYSEAQEARSFMERYKLEDLPCLISEGLDHEYRVYSPPYALFIDEEGIVRSKGVVNHLEHLESLINVVDLGHNSIQEWAGGNLNVATETAAGK
jgi:methylamine dehydrogenase accessory protein MauD